MGILVLEYSKKIFQKGNYISNWEVEENIPVLESVIYIY